MAMGDFSGRFFVAVSLLAVNQLLLIYIIKTGRLPDAKSCGLLGNELRADTGVAPRRSRVQREFPDSGFDDEELNKTSDTLVHVERPQQNAQHVDRTDPPQQNAKHVDRTDLLQQNAQQYGAEENVDSEAQNDDSPDESMKRQKLQKSVDKESSDSMGWTGFNQTEVDNFRTLVLSHTRVATHLYTSRENVPLHSNLTFFETDLTITVMRGTFRYFPPTVEFPTRPYSSCSVVGNSGILSETGCGWEIDSTDYVFRLNLPPIRGRFTKDVGNHTNFVTLNPSVLQNRYGLVLGQKNVSSFMRAVEAYPAGAVIYTHPFHLVKYRKPVYRAFQAVSQNGTGQVVRWSHPDFLRAADRFWKEQYHLKEERITSGLLVVTIALSMCEETHLYGFWPYRTAPDGKTLAYHYFKRPISNRDHKLIWNEEEMFKVGVLKNKSHKMDKEFEVLKQLHRKGVLRIHADKCGRSP